MSDREPPASPSPAPSSLRRHLARGTVGFALIASALLLARSRAAIALPLALPGLLVLRGCPSCWIAGLLEILSARRLQRVCAGDTCTLRPHPQISLSASAKNSRMTRPSSSGWSSGIRV